ASGNCLELDCAEAYAHFERKKMLAIRDQDAIRYLSYFLHRDLISEVIRIERINSSVRCFRLRVHEVHQWWLTCGPGKCDVMGIVVSHPIHLPGAEQALARLRHYLVA